jgi:HSP20 family protein
MAMPGLSDSFSAILALQRALESRFESDWMGGGTAGTGAYPPIQHFLSRAMISLRSLVPGIDKTELSIEAKENTIRISGKKALNYEENASIHRRERSSGVFDRTISLPLQIEPDGIRAEYNDGLLALFIPRAASEKPRTIQIK